MKGNSIVGTTRRARDGRVARARATVHVERKPREGTERVGTSREP